MFAQLGLLRSGELAVEVRIESGADLLALH
jgi:hypothetical protein